MLPGPVTVVGPKAGRVKEVAPIAKVWEVRMVGERDRDSAGINLSSNVTAVVVAWFGEKVQLAACFISMVKDARHKGKTLLVAVTVKVVVSLGAVKT